MYLCWLEFLSDFYIAGTGIENTWHVYGAGTMQYLLCVGVGVGVCVGVGVFVPIELRNIAGYWSTGAEPV